ncbi:MAG: tRNA (N6-threonylcarbamoyladenosine(37)-N6)-methyltransferase TrmO [Pseudomonadota bacterium]
MYSVDPIATIRSCYTERFGIPRQAGLVTSAEAQIVFRKNTYNELSLRGLEEFSHIWVIFIFHKHHYNKPKPLVQPPRLGGKTNIGVYATRSPNRINSLGLSCVELSGISTTDHEIQVQIHGGDFLDGTPVVDIKPYIAFADAIDNSRCGWAEPLNTTMPVQWLDSAQQALQQYCDAQQLDFNTITRVIDDTLAHDPRPAYERNKDGKPDQLWHMRIFEIDISFSVTNGVALIVNCRQ